MVGRLFAEVETAKDEVRASVGEVLHVRRNEAEDPDVPIGHALEIDGLQDDMSEPHDAGRLDRAADLAVDARHVMGGVGRRHERFAQRQAFDPALALQQPHAAPGRIEQFDAASSTGDQLRGEPLRPELRRVALEVGVLGHAERGADEAIPRSLHGDRNTGRRARPAGHDALGRRTDDLHAEVAPEALSRREPALLPPQEGQFDGAAQRGRPPQRLDARRQPALRIGLGLAQDCAGMAHRKTPVSARMERPQAASRKQRDRTVGATRQSQPPPTWRGFAMPRSAECAGLARRRVGRGKARG